MNLEALEHPDAATNVPYTVRLLVDQIARGDYFMCASERQRDYWLGMLAACGRVDAAAYGEDPDLRALIDVVPFGLPREAADPLRAGPARRDRGHRPGRPAVRLERRPVGLVRSRDAARRHGARRSSTPNIRVLFMGVQRPGEDAPSAAAQRLMRRSDELGLTGVHVFFRSWTPYETRHNTYLDATAAVSLHHAHLESRFSFRTRLLDCIWATVPILGTDGDVLAELVRDEHLGLTVRPGDVDGVADALVALATDRDSVTTQGPHASSRSVAPRFRWSTATLPLAAWLDRAERRPRHPRPNLPAMPVPPGYETAGSGLRRTASHARCVRACGSTPSLHGLAERRRRSRSSKARRSAGCIGPGPPARARRGARHQVASGATVRSYAQSAACGRALARRGES